MAREKSAPLAMERRMASLFVLALALIVWQALRTKPLAPPPLEISTRPGEQLLPLAVPSWRTATVSAPEGPDRQAELRSRSLLWPGVTEAKSAEVGCGLFLRISGQHWVRRPASGQELRRWVGSAAPGPSGPWRRLRLPVASFLDDDDGDGDPLDAGELRPSGPGGEVEVFCDGGAPAGGGKP